MFRLKFLSAALCLGGLRLLKPRWWVEGVTRGGSIVLYSLSVHQGFGVLNLNPTTQLRALLLLSASVAALAYTQSCASSTVNGELRVQPGATWGGRAVESRLLLPVPFFGGSSRLFKEWCVQQVLFCGRITNHDMCDSEAPHHSLPTSALTYNQPLQDKATAHNLQMASSQASFVTQIAEMLRV